MANKLIYNLYQVFSKEASKAPSIKPQEAYQEIQKGNAILVDVREQEELQSEGIASSAKWIATSEIEVNSPKWQKFVEELPKDKTIITYCAAGVRSGRAAARLESMGFRTENVGGYQDWAGAGLPTQKFQS